MEIFDQQTGLLQANISSKRPGFTVSGLDSGKLLKIIIYASNVKGRSDSVLLEAFTLKAAEKQTGKLSFFYPTSLVVSHRRIPFPLKHQSTQSNECISLITTLEDDEGVHICRNWKLYLMLLSSSSSFWSLNTLCLRLLSLFHRNFRPARDIWPINDALIRNSSGSTDCFSLCDYWHRRCAENAHGKQ